MLEKKHYRESISFALIIDPQIRNGQRYINLKTMNKVQIQLRPEVIIGTRVITGE
ncbi:MAG: hypothetical protein M8357_12690 [Desulfobulbaceae bacterium]|nr:hypothetical protein [Desulfobulbaceae bacterium]